MDVTVRGAGGHDAAMSACGAALFSLALGVGTVAAPLLALSAGYSAAQVGLLIALSAVSQMGTRVFMGAMMRRLPDKVFVAAAAALLGLSSLLLVLSAEPASFVVSQLLQGVARAFFWTGTQTHAVRVSPSAVGALARVNVASGVGQVSGPLVAGLLTERSTDLALAVAAGVCALTIVPALLLVRLPPFVPLADRAARGRIWQRPGVDAACWSGATAGAWRGLLNSYVPVVLARAQQSPSMIGLLIAGANGASLVATGLAGRVHGAGLRRSLVLGIVTTGLGTALVAPAAAVTLAAAVALAISGFGAGVLQTVGPAVATDAVDPEERGEAIASAGTFRAGALFVAPFGVAGLVTLLPLAPALSVAGLVLVAPVWSVRRWRPTAAAGP